MARSPGIVLFYFVLFHRTSRDNPLAFWATHGLEASCRLPTVHALGCDYVWGSALPQLADFYSKLLTHARTLFTIDGTHGGFRFSVGVRILAVLRD